MVGKQNDTNIRNATYGLSREQAYRDQLGGKVRQLRYLIQIHKLIFKT